MKADLSPNTIGKPRPDPRPAVVAPTISCNPADLLARGVPLTSVAAFTRLTYRELKDIRDAQRGVAR